MRAALRFGSGSDRHNRSGHSRAQHGATTLSQRLLQPQASEGRLGGASIASLEKRITRADVERELIQQTLKRNLGRISSAAAELGVSRPTLYELMEKLGIARWEQMRSASLHLAMTTS